MANRLTYNVCLEKGPESSDKGVCGYRGRDRKCVCVVFNY